jgi:membrane protein
VSPLKDLNLAKPLNPFQQMILECVSWRPLNSLWDLQGVPVRVIARRTWNSLWKDDIFGSAAELGYWFMFALFPTLVVHLPSSVSRPAMLPPTMND